MQAAITGIGSAAVGKIGEEALNYFCGDWNKSCFMGQRKRGDKLLFSQKVRKTGANATFSLSHVCEIPFSGREIITYLEVKEMWQDGTGGKVDIKEGGVGKNYVVIVLTSQKMRGMAFDVNIYGQ